MNKLREQSEKIRNAFNTIEENKDQLTGSRLADVHKPDPGDKVLKHKKIGNVDVYLIESDVGGQYAAIVYTVFDSSGKARRYVNKTPAIREFESWKVEA